MNQQTKDIVKSAVFWGITRRRVVIVYRRCPETSVNNYHTTPRNTPEDRNFINIAVEA
jgi:hypothetical protein